MTADLVILDAPFGDQATDEPRRSVEAAPQAVPLRARRQALRWDARPARARWPLGSMISQAHSACTPQAGPSSSASIVRLAATASRAALRAVAARWLRHPRPGVHSPGFGAYEEDGGRLGTGKGLRVRVPLTAVDGGTPRSLADGHQRRSEPLPQCGDLQAVAPPGRRVLPSSAGPSLFAKLRQPGPAAG
jgi:hypothetical protein